MNIQTLQDHEERIARLEELVLMLLQDATRKEHPSRPDPLQGHRQQLGQLERRLGL